MKQDWPEALIAWFLKNRRPLPWREERGPYQTLVSEMMLQQTRIEAVIPYYQRFMSRYPDPQSLAKAPLEAVLKEWEGLGYYSRARHLHEAAKEIVRRGAFPDTYEDILSLPGVGPYTAGIIGAICFGLPKAAVDGNVLRVCARLFLIEENVLLPAVHKRVTALLEEVYPVSDPGAFTEGLMELGETLCRPQSPICEACPLQESCGAFREDRTRELPVREQLIRKKREALAVVIAKSPEGELFLFPRPESGVLGNLLELPNVERPEKEDQIPGLLLEKYGLSIPQVSFLKHERHAFTHILWEMEVYLGEGALMTEEKIGYQKVTPQELSEKIMLPQAFRKLLGNI